MAAGFFAAPFLARARLRDAWPRFTAFFPAADFARHALETATRLAEGPTRAYGRVKALFDQSWDADLAAQLDAETEAIGDIGLTGDFQEGIQAFAEKRRAWFQGV